MKKYLCSLTLIAGLFGCQVYNQNIMFKTKASIITQQDSIRAVQNNAERNYLIQKNDIIEVRVFTDSGEVIIDPPRIGEINNLQNQLLQPGFQNQLNMGGGTEGNTLPLQFPNFLVKQDGFAKLPKVGEVKLEGLTLDQADRLLEQKFEEFYPGPFVRTRYTNKRIFVFKGNTGTIFPLRNEKINLIEVLAQTGGMSENLRASNIRLIRGDLSNPSVYLINLKTFEGVSQQNLTIEPNDIVYVEPIRKSFLEALRDITPVLSFLTTTLTFILLVDNISN
ncbi:MAG: hypothetical protein OHK0053_02080 [Microscillaceae bacterium]